MPFVLFISSSSSSLVFRNKRTMTINSSIQRIANFSSKAFGIYLMERKKNMQVEKHYLLKTSGDCQLL